MKGYLGEFEELVLLTIVILNEEAYGVAIQQDIEKKVWPQHQYWCAAFHPYTFRGERFCNVLHGRAKPGTRRPTEAAFRGHPRREGGPQSHEGPP